LPSSICIVRFLCSAPWKRKPSPLDEFERESSCHRSQRTRRRQRPSPPSFRMRTSRRRAEAAPAASLVIRPQPAKRGLRSADLRKSPADGLSVSVNDHAVGDRSLLLNGRRSLFICRVLTRSMGSLANPEAAYQASVAAPCRGSAPRRGQDRRRSPPARYVPHPSRRFGHTTAPC